ncbi:non-muscle caldesmon isoform X4 [Xenopus laevis]|uniref:Non-muscle caldesmon isoform X4 n=1 Tax=Xenopus laevis TaxID=8355 RepID=A0A8J0UVH0_XENLA|nr:non-muscle caldesmon isoform X4 [Xenopus laevis]
MVSCMYSCVEYHAPFLGSYKDYVSFPSSPLSRTLGKRITYTEAADMLSRSQYLVNLSKLTYQRNDDDDEEAARERRRRARQERQSLQKDYVGDGTEVNSQNSVTTETTRTSTNTSTDISLDDEAALLERLAKREERRQQRLKEALERQKEFDPTITDETLSSSKYNRNGQHEVEENHISAKEDDSVTHRSQYEVEETEIVTTSYQKNDSRKEVQEEVQTEKTEEKEEEPVETQQENLIKNNQVKEEKAKGQKEDLKASWERKKDIPETKAHNGESGHERAPQKLKQLEKFGGTKSHPTPDETDSVSKIEADKRLDDLRRRRGETESGEFDKLKQKQQEAAVELEELKKKREERRKIMEEEEQRKKQEEAERKTKEEEEKKRLKEEIEKRRAEAAEKRKNMPEDGLSEEKKPFKCFTPKGSSFKIEERAEFLNKSAQKSSKSTQSAAAVSKIDSRLEQYTSAIGSNKSAKPSKTAPSDLPLPADGIRNIKSMWEKGNVFSSPSGALSPNKETANIKVGVSSRINEWLTKTPETNKATPSKPSDLKPGDVSGKRNIWEKPEEKPGSPTKVTVGGKKPDRNGLRFEKEP